MSPRPPPLIYPRTTLPPSPSTMAESPRPMPSTAFHHQLPPPIFGNPSGQAPRFPGPGPILAPLSIPSSGGGSTLPQPPAQQSKQPTHIPPQHSLPQHAPSPLQTPHKREVRQVSTTPYGIITSQPFNSPAPSGFSSPASFNFDQRYDERRFSQGSDRERRRYINCWYVPLGRNLD